MRCSKRTLMSETKIKKATQRELTIDQIMGAVADSNIGVSDRNFDPTREIVEFNITKPKSGNEKNQQNDESMHCYWMGFWQALHGYRAKKWSTQSSPPVIACLISAKEYMLDNSSAATAQKVDWVTAAENIYGEYLIANNSRQGTISTGLQHTDQFN